MSRDMLVLIRAEDLRALADTDAAELMAAKDVALRELVHRMQARAEAANAEALERDAARMPDLADCLSTEATTLSDWARKLEALTTPDTGEQSGNAILQMEDHIRRMDAALQDCLHHLRSTSYHPVKDRLFEILEAVEYSTPDTGEQINEL